MPGERGGPRGNLRGLRRSPGGDRTPSDRDSESRRLNAVAAAGPKPGVPRRRATPAVVERSSPCHQAPTVQGTAGRTRRRSGPPMAAGLGCAPNAS